jgi:hypothetical protein
MCTVSSLISRRHRYAVSAPTQKEFDARAAALGGVRCLGLIKSTGADIRPQSVKNSRLPSYMKPDSQRKVVA